MDYDRRHDAWQSCLYASKTTVKSDLYKEAMSKSVGKADRIAFWQGF